MSNSLENPLDSERVKNDIHNFLLDAQHERDSEEKNPASVLFCVIGSGK